MRKPQPNGSDTPGTTRSRGFSAQAGCHPAHWLRLGLAALALCGCSPASDGFSSPATGTASAGRNSSAVAGSAPVAGSSLPSAGSSLPTAGSSLPSAGMSLPQAGVPGSAGRGSGNAGRAGRGMTMAGAPAPAPAAGSGGSTQAGAGGSSGFTQNLTCKLNAPPSTGDPKQDCVDRINQFRTQCACLTPLARWNDGEACADMMAMYDSGGTTAHAGFMARICPGGNAQNECPGWQSEAMVVSGCLQSMWNEGPPPTNPCDGDCFQKYGHFINMTNTRMKKVACGFFKTTAGKLWSVQNFSP